MESELAACRGSARIVGVETLDNPVWHALCGPHATLAEGSGAARRYDPAYAPFAALADGSAGAWDALATIVGPGGLALLLTDFEPTSGWQRLRTFPVLQMVLEAELGGVEDPRVESLDATDATEMAALVAAAEPGPWAACTHELGAFVGIRVDGRLVAMAGQRMSVPGATELSAVCTDPDFRGHGYGRAVVVAIAAHTVGTGTQPFLHVRDDNVGARRVYEHVGFRTRAAFNPGVYQAPTD
jgi:ribosomal protein S18 acetylase RimI-like enzyme